MNDDELEEMPDLRVLVALQRKALVRVRVEIEQADVEARMLHSEMQIHADALPSDFLQRFELLKARLAWLSETLNDMQSSDTASRGLWPEDPLDRFGSDGLSNN